MIPKGSRRRVCFVFFAACCSNYCSQTEHLLRRDPERQGDPAERRDPEEQKWIPGNIGIQKQMEVSGILLRNPGIVLSTVAVSTLTVMYLTEEPKIYLLKFR